jgi:hypothetical protein
MRRELTHCYIDESVHNDFGFVATALIFSDKTLEPAVAGALGSVGLVPFRDELKSSARMDADARLRTVRDNVLALAGSEARVAIFLGPYDRGTIGKHSLQALQTVLIRNGLETLPLDVHFDADIFPSNAEAERLHPLFRALQNSRIHPREDSRLVLGIQVADVVAHSFAQIVKAEIAGEAKEVDIGGPKTGYPAGTKAPLGWSLLMGLRHALFTRPIAYRGEEYSLATDPIILDPVKDDPTTYGQNPVLLGWGLLVAPDAGIDLRSAVERSLGRIWLGCIH